MHKYRGLVQSLSYGVANQLVSSGTSFLISAMLVVMQTKSEFGLYSLASASIFIVAGVISSLLGAQYTVTLPNVGSGSRDLYGMEYLWATFVLMGFCCAAALIIWVVTDSRTYKLALPTSIALGTYVIREFLNRVAFSARAERALFFSTVLCGLTVVAVFSAIFLAGTSVSAESALYIYAAGQVVAIIMLYPQSLARRAHRELRPWYLVIKESWPNGKWNFLAVVANSTRGQAHNIIAGPLLGLSAVGEINAARILIQPAILFFTPLNQILLPRLSALRSDNLVISKYAPKLALLYFLISVVYCAAIYPVLPFLLGLSQLERYGNIEVLVCAWFAVVVAFSVRSALSIFLEANLNFSGLFRASMAVALLVVPGVLAATIGFGASGSILVVAASELLLALLIGAQIGSRLGDRGSR